MSPRNHIAELIYSHPTHLFHSQGLSLCELGHLMPLQKPLPACDRSESWHIVLQTCHPSHLHPLMSVPDIMTLSQVCCSACNSLQFCSFVCTAICSQLSCGYFNILLFCKIVSGTSWIPSILKGSLRCCQAPSRQRKMSRCCHSPLHRVAQRNVAVLCAHALCLSCGLWHVGCSQVLHLLRREKLVQRVCWEGCHHVKHELCILLWLHAAVQPHFIGCAHLRAACIILSSPAICLNLPCCPTNYLLLMYCEAGQDKSIT